MIKSKKTTNEQKLPIKERIQEIFKKPKEKFLTESQKKFWDMMDENEITFCFGGAGTGKSHMALKKALDLLHDQNNKYEKILIVRPAVEAGESVGLLPGTLSEKLAPYIYPSFYLLGKIIGKASLEKLKIEEFVEVGVLSYMRGWNVDNTILVFEEAQNATPQEMKLLLTRIGFNSKFIITGDLEQSDKFYDKTKSGLFDAKKRLEGMNNVGVFEFSFEDVVRNPLITEILKRYY